MANKGSSSKTKIHRITATDDAAKKITKKTKSADKKAKPKKTVPVKDTTEKTSLLSSITGYFKGAWQELKLVRWPTRRATWAMTLAILIFSLFFIIMILLLDTSFNWIFNQILK